MQNCRHGSPSANQMPTSASHECKDALKRSGRAVYHPPDGVRPFSIITIDRVSHRPSRPEFGVPQITDFALKSLLEQPYF